MGRAGGGTPDACPLSKCGCAALALSASPHGPWSHLQVLRELDGIEAELVVRQAQVEARDLEQLGDERGVGVTGHRVREQRRAVLPMVVHHRVPHLHSRQASEKEAAEAKNTLGQEEMEVTRLSRRLSGDREYIL